MVKPDHHHWYVDSSQFDQIIGWGLELGSKSFDGSAMFITGKKGLDLSEVITASKPSWMIAPNFPKLNNSEAKIAVALVASDGTITTGWRGPNE